jgi:bifunctional DNA-binding transcriptional regulator/antitoxin component of YhaV-PrlF toxin-antitoxin module
MESIELRIQQRAFPSKGRARLHESLLGKLGLKEGDEVELTVEKSAKPVVVTVFADSLVDEGYIRLSTEDIAKLGTAPGTMVTVKKRPPLGDRMKKGAGDTAESVKSGAAQGSEAIKSGAHKASEGIKSGASSAKQSIEKGADSVAKKVKPEKGEKKE